ncbi:MAG TPA: HD domain-containing protein [Candidatus Acidoferrum sp.]|nr:HD domain-containing protein [Candidatus Acidoferrum sp.]
MKVIRDSVHGDIELSPEEMQLVHTRGFQRLNGCKQLGLSYLVYPAAKHTRFEHVLGVMELATRIAQRLGEHFPLGTGEGDERMRILRLAALLHDIAHVPFGHTLEDEMPSIPEHDAPSDASGESRMDSLASEVLQESGNSEYVKPVLQVLRAISKSKEDRDLYGLVEGGEIRGDLLVLADIIGNTICADLLDYIKRDHMMTGIRATYDDRIFRYFATGDHEFQGKSYKRLLIRLVKNGRVRGDCLADLLDILKLRYNLSDKVLFHPKKCAADAMLIKAVAELGISESDLMKYSDDGLLDTYGHRHPLLKMLRSGTLLKPVFVSRLEHVHCYNEQHDKNDLIEDLRTNPKLRTQVEKRIEKELGLPADRTSVLIFCPAPDMTLKPVRVLVQWKSGKIRRLNSITDQDDVVTAKQVSILQQIYPDLWKLYLLVLPELRSRGNRIKEKFREVLRSEAGLNATCDPAFENYLETGCINYGTGQLLDKQLYASPAFNVLPYERKVAVWGQCHAKLPLDTYDEDYADVDLKTIASRLEPGAISQQLQTIIDAVLQEEASAAKGEQTRLPPQ